MRSFFVWNLVSFFLAWGIIRALLPLVFHEQLLTELAKVFLAIFLDNVYEYRRILVSLLRKDSGNSPLLLISIRKEFVKGAIVLDSIWEPWPLFLGMTLLLPFCLELWRVTNCTLSVVVLCLIYWECSKLEFIIVFFFTAAINTYLDLQHWSALNYRP